MSENESIVSTGLTVTPTDWSISFTDGEVKPLVSIGDNANFHSVSIGTEGFLTRTTVEFKTRQPNISATSPSGYTQQTSEVLIKMPLELPDGKTTVNTAKLTLRTDVNTSLDDIRTLRAHMLQIVGEAQFNRFWKHASVA